MRVSCLVLYAAYTQENSCLVRQPDLALCLGILHTPLSLEWSLVVLELLVSFPKYLRKYSVLRASYLVHTLIEKP